MQLTPPAPFDLRLALFGHGWIDLAPHAWSTEHGTWRTVLDLGEPVDVEVTARGTSLRVRAAVTHSAQRAQLRAALRRMLRLDQELTPFWEICARDPSRHWIAERGAGRLLRAPALFEDLLKLLFTTNCSWAATRLMTRRLVEALGRAAPSGARAFPDAATCAAHGERFWRDVVRTGYRAKACATLARAFAEGTLSPQQFEDPALPATELRRRLLALPGFGPYAAGQALRLLGHYEDLALDSWCRARLATLRGRRRPPSDRTIARDYARFGTWRGLVLWCDLTAEWHRDEPIRILAAQP